MSCKTTMETVAVHCAVAIIKGHPDGITLDDVAKKLALSRAYTKNLLTFARANGLVDCMQIGRAGLWLSADQIERFRAAHDTAAKARKRAAERDRNQRRIAAGYFASRPGRPSSRELPDAPEVSRANAAAPLPFVCRAPASVFHLAARLAPVGTFPAANEREAA